MSGLDEANVGTARRRRVPTLLQQEAVECGAACLAMILAYHGRWVALEELRETCGVGRDGTKATNLLRAARSYGLVAKGLSKQVGQLAALPLPLVAFWNFNHFVVVESISPKRIWLNDPAVGPRSVTLQEFSDSFTGVVLAFQRGEAFKPGGRRLSTFEIARSRLHRSWGGLVFAMLAGFALVIPAIAASGYNLIFVNEILIKQNHRWLPAVALAVVVTALLNGLLNYLRDQSLSRLQTALGAGQSAAQMWTLLHLPLTFFNQRFAGDIANRFSLIDRLAGLISSNIGPSVVAICSIVGYGLALFLLDPVLATLVSLCSAAALAVLIVSARGLEDANRRQVSEEAKLQGITIQGLSMVEDFKAAGIEDLFLARWAGAQAKILSSEQAAQFKSKLLSSVSETLIAMTGVIVLVVGGLRIMDGVLTIGVLVAFQALMDFLTHNVMSLVSVGDHFQQSRGIAERLDDMNRYPTKGSGQSYDGEVPSRNDALPSLRTRSLTYGFAPFDPPLIDDLSLTIEPGMRLALVGESGSGKSTLGRLLVGLAEPRSGHLELGETPLGAWPLSALRKTIAYVDQNVGLFEGTISDNITLWDKTISEARIVKAAQDAQAHDFISRRPGSYLSRVSEGGSNFSGGERQRLAIARALLLDPSILVLDEATSALDPVSEVEVMNAVRRRGCSAIIIAHRLSTIRDCDRIVVLARGRVLESGTHDELVRRDGPYRRLVEH